MQNFCLYLFFVLLGLAGCQSKQQTGEQTRAIVKPSAFNVKYARGFSVSYTDSYKLVTVHRPSKLSARPVRYVLIPRGAVPPASLPEGAQVIEVPLRTVVCLSTTHAALFELLGAADRITGFADTKYISSPAIRKRIDEGKIKEIGRENGVNIEAVIDLQPDVVMAYSMGGASEAHSQLSAAGQSVILNAEYLEASPLGKAEWLKFAAVFLDREEEAENIFNQVEAEYLRLRTLAQQPASLPSVFVDIPYSNVWYMAGGQSFAGQFLDDAGANYLWASDTTSGSTQLNIEEVYDKAHKADFWLNTGSYASIAELTGADPRFANFEAVRKGNVYNNNKRSTPQGGNEYWELGAVRPDLVLADLVKIFHPELLKDRELYFYQQLK